MSAMTAGRTLAGKYRLVAPLGRGSMGEVWQAEHLVLKSSLAIKVIHPQHLDGSSETSARGLLERFFREARATAALRSQNIVQILDYGHDGEVPFIAMELLEGETLEARLARVTALPPREAAAVITQVARGVGIAHETGVVHRDLKPANVFLVKGHDQEFVKVLDFGIAKVATTVSGSYKATQTGMTVGTPAYMSPEQIQGSRGLDHRADLWSLAIIAFECLTGDIPFEGETFGALVLEICAKPIAVPSSRAPVPQGFDAWFAKSASRDPDARFQSAKEFAETLRAVLCPDDHRASKPNFQRMPSDPELSEGDTEVMDRAQALTGPGSGRDPISNPNSAPAVPAVAGPSPAATLPMGTTAGGASIPSFGAPPVAPNPASRIPTFGAPPTPGGRSAPPSSAPGAGRSAPLSSAPAAASPVRAFRTVPPNAGLAAAFPTSAVGAPVAAGGGVAFPVSANAGPAMRGGFAPTGPGGSVPLAAGNPVPPGHVGSAPARAGSATPMRAGFAPPMQGGFTPPIPGGTAPPMRAGFTPPIPGGSVTPMPTSAPLQSFTVPLPPSGAPGASVAVPAPATAIPAPAALAANGAAVSPMGSPSSTARGLVSAIKTSGRGPPRMVIVGAVAGALVVLVAAALFHHFFPRALADTVRPSGRPEAAEAEGAPQRLPDTAGMGSAEDVVPAKVEGAVNAADHGAPGSTASSAEGAPVQPPRAPLGQP